DFAEVEQRVLGSANVVPFLTNGTDNDSESVGFQPLANVCDGVAPVRVFSDATETTLLSSHGTIQAGVNAAVSGNAVRVDAGTYVENVLVNKAILIRGANFGINPNTGTRVAESILNGTFSLQSSGINIDGFKVTGAGPAFAAAGTGPWSDVSLTNNFAEANTGQQTIVYGFASGGVTTSIGAENWVVSNNRIVDVQSANATAIALFNIDGLVINGNVIEHSNTSFTGRRGINLDGSINVTVSGNTIDMGDVAPSVLTIAPFGIQISMSDRAVSNITISGNSFTRAYSAVVGLSQRNLSDVLIENNEVTDVFRAFTFNSGGAVPNASGTNMANITITGNLVEASNFAVWLRNLHSAALTGPVSFTNISVTENSFTGGSFTVDADLNVTDGPVSGTCNWYGSSDFENVDVSVSGAINFIPFLTNGTDNEPSVIGFQPLANVCDGVAPVRVYSDGTETTLLSSHGTIQAGVNAAVTGNVVRVDAGTFTENVLVDKAILIRGANFGINPNTGTRVAESILSGTFSLRSSGINIDGFKVTGTGAAFAAGGTGPWSDVSLTNNIAEGNTGQQTIVYGFASGAVTTSIGAQNWVVSNNLISDIQLADATAIALFNITGVTISNNTILHSNASFARRRGMNIDGSRDVVISGNTVNLGLVNPLADNAAFDGARYSLQLSASDRSVSNVSVSGNTFGGAYDGIITLGNGEFSGINLLSNEISNVAIGIRTQAGSNTNVGSHSNFTISNNKISSSNRSIFLQSGGAGTLDPYNAISITENSLLRSSVGAALEIDAIAVITDGSIAANCNWFGSGDFAEVEQRVLGSANVVPFLTNGTDNDPASIGFQPVSGICNGVEGDDSLVGFWKMDEGSGNILVDHSGNVNNAVIQNTSGVFWSEGIIGLAVNLSGNGGRFGLVPHSSSLEIEDALTISAWVKPNVVGRNTIISKADGNGFELWLDNNGQIEFRLNRGNSGTLYRLKSSYNYIQDVGEWIHVAATFDGSNSKIFINGVEDISVSYAPFTIGTTSGNLVIGALGTIQRFNGAIDDLRLYGRALEETEIFDLYNEGLSIPEQPQLLSPSNGNNSVLASDVVLSWLPSEFANGYKIQLATDDDFLDILSNVDVGNVLTFNPSGLNSSTQYYWRVLSYNGKGESDWSEVWTFSTLEDTNTEFGLVGYWKMDEGSGNILVDHSGNVNNAVIQNTSGVFWSEGIIGLAVNLSGNGGRFGLVPHSSSLEIEDALTISAWVKPNVVGRNTIISKADGNGFELWLDNNGQIEFRLNRGNSGTLYRLKSSYNYIQDVGEWIHVAATFDGSNSKIFINGVEDISVSYAPFTIGTTSGNLVIGALGTIQRFNGAIDDLRLYGRSLSPSEISSLAAIGSEALRIRANQFQKNGSNETQENPSSMENNSELRDTPKVTRIYPNPVIDLINLELSNREEERVEISIFDMKGILLLNQEYDSENGTLILDISNLRLKTGTHVLLVNTNGHQQVFKFLKK
ncbi:T9SS type A sorting domain-containing protein, partial [Aquiflexum sp. LQ15W]|uniref:LamG-like jellyroll fold domain-containing protein n=1 Tax=Cognataquiflexum nitidum TaxID=2922272 RepID=UPI001F13E535